jgi:hypothetical protein
MKINYDREVLVPLTLTDELFRKSKIAATKAGLSQEDFISDLIVRNI